MTPIEEITLDDLKALVEKSECYHYGLIVIEYDGGEYAIAMDDEEADSACKEYITGALWAFNEFFLTEMTGIDLKVFVALSQSNLCEAANDAILALVEKTCGIDELVAAAIDADGRGHFLACWDGEELELDCGAYAYRYN